MKEILNTGISNRNDESLNRKIKLNNLIVIFIGLACISYVPMYLYSKLYYLMLIPFCILAVSTLCFILQDRKKHLLGFSVLSFSMIALMSLISMTFGLISNIHFFLLCACMTSIVFFDDNKRLRFTIFSFALACFFGLLAFLPYKTELIYSSQLLEQAIKLYGYINYFIIFVFTTFFLTSFVKQNSMFQKKNTDTKRDIGA